MNNNLLKAKEILIKGNYTCVLLKDDIILTSSLKGVKPLVDFYQAKEDYSNFVAADRVIGKGAAFIYLLLKIKSIYAHIISTPALELLKRYDVNVIYDNLVDNIINQKGTDLCPFEKALLNISDINEAYNKILAKMDELNIQHK